MDAEELRLFGAGLRRTAEAHDGAALDAALDGLGWYEALQVLPAQAVRLLFDALGRSGSSSGALERVLATGLGLDLTRDAAVVLPALEGFAPAGRLVDDRLVVRGLTTSSAAGGQALVVVAPVEDGRQVAVEVPTAELVLRPVQGFDPRLGLIEVIGDLRPARAGDPVPGGWSAALRLARLALASELVGAGRTMLDLARVHALERVQFGRPISAFQAVRHRLADALVALEMADALIDAAWQDGTEQTAAMAKAVAGRAARTAARHCQQVLAGIGFTTEHRLHLYVRRTFVLDQMLGSARTLTRELGEQVLAQRRLPPVLPL